MVLTFSFNAGAEKVFIEKGGLTARVLMFNMMETTTIVAEHAAALDMRTFRRPTFSMKKYGLGREC